VISWIILPELVETGFRSFTSSHRKKLQISFSMAELDEKKLHLIINQILHLDDTDEESTIWDAVDEVLICGKGND
jgi:ring-1,2-phenylacetyl-CoA epoxidase subunit PaaE